MDEVLLIALGLGGQVLGAGLKDPILTNNHTSVAGSNDFVAVEREYAN